MKEAIDKKQCVLKFCVFPSLMFGRTDSTQANFETSMEQILNYSDIFEEDKNLSRLRPDLSHWQRSTGLGAACMGEWATTPACSDAYHLPQPSHSRWDPKTKRGNRGLENDSGPRTVCGQVKGGGAGWRPWGALYRSLLGSWVTPLLPLPSCLKTQKSEIVQTPPRERIDSKIIVDVEKCKTSWRKVEKCGEKASLRFKFKLSKSLHCTSTPMPVP